MQAGKLREKVKFHLAVENSWGECCGFEVVASMPAEVEVKAGNLSDENGADSMTQTISVLLRDSRMLSKDHMLEYDGERYTITSFIRDKKERSVRITGELHR